MVKVSLFMKNKSILPFHWQEEIENVKVESIGEDIILLDRPIITTALQYPFRVDVTVAIICTKGKMEGSINMQPYTTGESCLITVIAGQIMEYKYISKDFTGLFIIMSNNFTHSLMREAHERLPLLHSVLENPVTPLKEESLNGMINYFQMLKRMAQEKEHPYRLEVARHLTLAFFYGASIDLHKFTDNRKKSHSEVLTEKFLNLVQIFYKKERELEFYAGKLSLTPKHLSKVIKNTTNKQANNLINDYVILEAKALLKSTNMTIQQISDELNFPSQSFFGKYFKRITGMSPKEYKSMSFTLEQ